jgi:hypothetical protein
MTKTLTTLVACAALALAACGGHGHGAEPSSAGGLAQPTTTTTVVRAVCPTEAACSLEYIDGTWYVDDIPVKGVDCPTEDSCYPMYHEELEGWMIHETHP